MRQSIFVVAVLLLTTACAAAGHPSAASGPARPSSSRALLDVLETPGPVEVDTIVAADWEVPLAGLVNLEHPRAREAGLRDRPEPIHLSFHAIRHPSRGLFLVDAGVERALRDRPDEAAVRGPLASDLRFSAMKIHVTLGDWLEAQREPVRGVFFTHLHVDHVLGVPDLPDGTPLYAGPGENDDRRAEPPAVRTAVDRALRGKANPSHWPFAGDPARHFAGVVDVFGDGTVWALSVPGHTRWGWDHGVEPGTFSNDRPRGAVSLAGLRTLVADHPAIDVRLGHQR